MTKDPASQKQDKQAKKAAGQKLVGQLMKIAIVLICLYIIFSISRDLLNTPQVRKPQLNSLQPKSTSEDTVPKKGLEAEARQDWDTALLIYKNSLAQSPNQPELWKRIADINIHLKRYTEAKNALAQMQNIKQTTQTASIDQALAAEESQDWDTALQIYKNNLAKNPNQPELLKRMADINSHLERHPDVVAALLDAIQQQPKNAALYADLAKAYTELKKPNDALFAMNMAAQLDPKNKDYSYRLALMTGPVSAGKSEAKNVEPATSPTQTALDAGYAAEMKKEWCRALEIYKNELARKPDQPAIWQKIGDIENELKNYARAIAAYQQVLIYQPKKVEVYIVIADAYAILKKPKIAFCTIEEALKLMPDNIKLLLKKAEFATTLEYYTLVDRIYHYILCVDPNNREALLGNAQLWVLGKQYEKAVLAYDYYLALYPDTKSAWIEFSNLQRTREDYLAAFHILEVYYRRFGESEEYLNEKATLLAIAGFPKEALCLVDSLLIHKPCNFDLLYLRALALNENEQWCEAMEIMDYIIAATPDPQKRKDIFYLWNAQTNQNLSDKIKGFIEAGGEHDNLTQGYGRWDNAYIRGAIQTDSRNLWKWEFNHDSEFGQNANFAVVENTHNINIDWYTNLSMGFSDNSIFVPRQYYGGSICRRLYRNKVVLYMGGHAYWWRPNVISTHDFNPGIIYTFDSPVAVEAGALISRFNPGAIYSTTYYVAVTQGKEKEHLIILRIGFGREAYQVVGPGLGVGQLAVVTAFPSEVLTATWRQWMGKNWGFNLSGELYTNRFYSRSGITLGLFMDFEE